MDAARKSHKAISSGDVDLVFLAIDPAREDAVTFTAPYVIIEGVYVVQADAPLTDPDNIDREGVRIGVREGSAYDLFLTRTLQSATLVRANEPTQGLRGAAPPGGSRRTAADGRLRRGTGTRIVEPAFMQVRQAVELPQRSSDEAVAAVVQFVEEIEVERLRRRGVAT